MRTEFIDHGVGYVGSQCDPYFGDTREKRLAIGTPGRMSSFLFINDGGRHKNMVEIPHEANALSS